MTPSTQAVSVSEHPATAVVFPGQGSQEEGMRESVERVAPDLLELVCDAVGEDPFERLGDGTRFVQPAIFACGVASWRELRETLEPVAFAGHSMGEIAALVAAESLTVTDGVRVIVARAALTAACESTGGMLAVMGLPALTVEELASSCGAHVANYNSARQIVVAGESDALDALTQAVVEHNGQPMRIEVAGAFHSPAMAGAMPGYAKVLEQVSFKRPRRPVYSSATGRVFTTPAAQLVRSLVEPVRWLEVMNAMYTAGMTNFVEARPGHVLKGLIKRTLKSATARTADEVLQEQPMVTHHE